MQAAQACSQRAENFKRSNNSDSGRSSVVGAEECTLSAERTRRHSRSACTAVCSDRVSSCDDLQRKLCSGVRSLKPECQEGRGRREEGSHELDKLRRNVKCACSKTV
eukprot:797414-Rhodomonas_salina.1